MPFENSIPPDDLKWIDNVRQRMLGVPERAYATYVLTRELMLEEVEGDLVECGVFAGVHPAIMWRASSAYGEARKIHLFDSFEGIPHAGVHDTDDIAGTLFSHGRDGVLAPTGISACSLEAVKGHMDEWGVDQSRLKYHKGWVENTVPGVAEQIEKIAMLRIDVDLYGPTKECLRHLLPLLRGYLVVDDMNLSGCRKAVGEFVVLDHFIPIDDFGCMYTRF